MAGALDVQAGRLSPRYGGEVTSPGSVPRSGLSNENALAEAQRAGLTERDPAADAEGHDTMAKGDDPPGVGLRPPAEPRTSPLPGHHRVTSPPGCVGGRQLRHDATLTFANARQTGTVTIRVQPETLRADDSLARINGVTNAVAFRASPVGEVTIIGPGAGPQLAGQGVLTDGIAVASSPVRTHDRQPG